jgi:hypothetical protein
MDTWSTLIGPRDKYLGVVPNLYVEVGFKLYNSDFIVLFSRFDGFYPFFRDLGPFLRPDIGEKLGDGYQI